MRKMNFGLGRTSLLSFLGLAGMSILTVHAEVINLTTSNGLFNTGYTVSDVALVPGSPSGSNNPQDGNYTYSYYANPLVGDAPPVTYAAGYYGTAQSSGYAYLAAPTAVDPYDGTGAHDWVPSNPATSQWITYLSDMTAVESTPVTAVTVYELVLSGIPEGDPVTLQGQIAADDNVAIYANGTEVAAGVYGYSATDDGTNNETNYNQLNTLAGLTFASNGENNVLDFVVVNNGGYPTCLNVQLSGSYSTAAVPEPSTYALLGVGLLGLLIWGRARREQV